MSGFGSGDAARGAGDEGPQGIDRSRPPRPRPLHRYGQNHLIDANILRAIVAQADVHADDVVLEVGAADGLLTRPLLERALLVHAFEIDQRFVPGLEALATRHTNLCVHFGDALKEDLSQLRPPPTALVANLAYNIAIPLIMTSIVKLPSVRRWGVMVQKELGDRLFATPSTKAYAAVSVLTQVACRLQDSRMVPPSAFRPRPRVDSCFITFRRWEAGESDAAVAAAEYRALERLVRRAFGQRRKVLTNSLGGFLPSTPLPARERVCAALEALGLSTAARPEELSPAQWVEFARHLGFLRRDPAEHGGEA